VHASTSASASSTGDLDPVELVPGNESLTAVVEGAQAADVTSIIPPDSLLVTVEGDALRLWDDAAARQLPGDKAAPLEALHALVRTVDADVLFVSREGLLSEPALERLRRGLLADTACATVSLVESSRAVVGGLPPPGIIAPGGGVVLARRDLLLLALDEAPLVGRQDLNLIGPSSTPGLIPTVLATLERPGFIHRGVSLGPEPVGATRRRVGPSRSRADAEIVLDGRCLEEPLSGTQVHVLGLVDGLVRAGVDVRVLRPTELHPTVVAESRRRGLALPLVERAGLGRPRILHRPFQVRSLHELADCLSIGERLVLTHQDMIRDRTPAYSRSRGAWEDYRRTTEAALTSADEVGFFSRHAAIDAASDGALDLERATVVHLGVDHVSGHVENPHPVDPLGGRPYLLVVGNAFWHKNRLFAVRLLQWLVEHAGWDGGLVLAGEHPVLGSSVAAERALVLETPSLRDRTVDLGRVSDADSAALYGKATLLVFPSLYEGFGLVPFEAARFGTASVYSHRGPMRELLPASGGLPSFDLDAAGPFVLSLLESASARERVVADVGDAARELTWERTAAGYVGVYARALERDPRPVSRHLVGVLPGGRTAALTDREAVVLDVYRRRRVFRTVVDGVLRASFVMLRHARAVRNRRSS
jgi:glycosyltransferase involved in cell wall biosynthesis